MIKCRELWVKFKDRNQNGQRCVVADQDGATYLRVEIELASVLVCSYVFEGPTSNKTIKAIYWPISELIEWSTDNIIS